MGSRLKPQARQVIRLPVRNRTKPPMPNSGRRSRRPGRRMRAPPPRQSQTIPAIQPLSDLLRSSRLSLELPSTLLRRLLHCQFRASWQSLPSTHRQRKKRSRHLFSNSLRLLLLIMNSPPLIAHLLLLRQANRLWTSCFALIARRRRESVTGRVPMCSMLLPHPRSLPHWFLKHSLSFPLAQLPPTEPPMESTMMS